MKRSNTGLLAMVMYAFSSIRKWFGFGGKTITGDSGIRTHKGHGQSCKTFRYSGKRCRLLTGQLRRGAEYFKAHPELWR